MSVESTDVDSDNLTLDTFLDRLEDGDDAGAVIRTLWRHYRSAIRALSNAMTELTECQERLGVDWKDRWEIG